MRVSAMAEQGPDSGGLWIAIGGAISGVLAALGIPKLVASIARDRTRREAIVEKDRRADIGLLHKHLADLVDQERRANETLRAELALERTNADRREADLLRDKQQAAADFHSVFLDLQKVNTRLEAENAAKDVRISNYEERAVAYRAELQTLRAEILTLRQEVQELRALVPLKRRRKAPVPPPAAEFPTVEALTAETTELVRRADEKSEQ